MLNKCFQIDLAFTTSCLVCLFQSFFIFRSFAIFHSTFFQKYIGNAHQCISLTDCFQMLLLVLSKFQRVNYLPFPLKSSASMWFSEDSGARGSRGKHTDTHTRRYIDTYIHTENIPTMQCVFRFNCEYFTQTESLLKCSLQTCLTERNCP